MSGPKIEHTRSVRREFTRDLPLQMNAGQIGQCGTKFHMEGSLFGSLT